MAGGSGGRGAVAIAGGVKNNSSHWIGAVGARERALNVSGPGSALGGNKLIESATSHAAAVANMAALNGGSVKISGGVKRDVGGGVAPVDAVGEGVEHAFLPWAGGAGSKAEDGATIRGGASRGSAAPIVRAVKVTGGVKDQSGVRRGTVAGAVEGMQNGLQPGAADGGREFECGAATAGTGDEISACARGAEEVTG